MQLKKIGLAGLLLLCTAITSTQAETYLNKWEKVTSNKQNLNLYIDFDSFRYYGTDVYYAAKYEDLINQNQKVVYLASNCQDNKAAMLFSEKYNPQKKYEINVRNYTPLFKPIKSSAAIFGLHNTACNYRGNVNPQEKEPDFGPYMRELQRRIKMNWNPPKGTESRRVVVLMKVTKDGNLVFVKIHQSSGSKAADNAALEAVEIAAPFRPLPAEYNRDSVDIQFTFDYNIFGQNRY